MFAPAVCESLCDREGNPDPRGRYLGLGWDWDCALLYFDTCRAPYPMFVSGSVESVATLEETIAQLVPESAIGD